MSDLFLNTLANLEIGGEVVYHAADPQSHDRVMALVDLSKFYVSIHKMGRRFKITIKRTA